MNETKDLQPVGMSIQKVANGISRTEVDILQELEKRNTMIERLLTYAIKATHGAQWSDQNGKPFPSAAAAEVMARRCGVSLSGVHSRRENSSDDRGAFYFYVVEGTASLPGGYDSVEALGTCSSRDQFLGTETKAGRPVSEIDEGNILKAAYSNLMTNAVTRLLGVRGLTWEALASLGINRGEAQVVNYNAGARGGSAERERTIPFGKSKGKTVSEADKADLEWILPKIKESAGDPEKAKYKASNEALASAIESELARRANSAAGTVVESNGTSAWTRIQTVGYDAGLTEDAIKAATKKATGKSRPSELVDSDVALVAKEIGEMVHQEPGSDF